jgi:hypothetical protein
MAVDKHHRLVKYFNDVLIAAKNSVISFLFVDVSQIKTSKMCVYQKLGAEQNYHNYIILFQIYH